MNEDVFDREVRKFLKTVGVTSQREIERVIRENAVQGPTLRLTMTLTSEDAPALRHVVETTIDLQRS